MSYTALARKWRPRTFSQLLGQDHIKTILVNSLELDRIHHAYLFTGTRGVGKTSVARLFAKSLNCEQGISANPCLECSNCVSIEQGRLIDLIEVDGASRTRVEDTRELLENIQYVPTSARFKIYLIDEVHMLSQHSFNALLKTLEEPPAHVKFLLATTDPQKLPITILSRCLQFNLKHLSIDLIFEHLKTILGEEKLDFENDALELIAKAARGSVRDSLSLLDQAIAGCDGKLMTHDIKQLLGYSQQDYALRLLQSLSQSDPHALLTISKQITAEGGPFQYVLDELLLHLHRISICQTIPESADFMVDSPELRTLAHQLTPEDVRLFYQIGIRNQEDMHLAPSPAIAFDMMLLRMYTFKPCDPVTRPLLTYEVSQPAAVKPEPSSFSNHLTLEADVTENDKSTNQSSSAIGNIEVETPDPVNMKTTDWIMLLSQLKLTGLALSAAENAEFIEKDNQRIILRINKSHASVFTSAVVKRIEQALSNHYHESIQIIVNSVEATTSTPATTKRKDLEEKHQHAESALYRDPVFQQLQHEFSAELVKTSISPHKDSL